MSMKIEGSCDPRFKNVREIFAANFENGLEVGAAVAATIDGKTVFDLWGGYADKAKTRPWTRDTLVNVFSTTKGIAAICAHRVVDQGKLDLNAPVSKYWPEFAQAGKEGIPVNYLLTHRAGLPAVRKQLPMDAFTNWPVMCAALAAQEPWWKPGTAHGYHALTFGYLIGEVIRRITGKTIGTYLREEIAGPLKLDVHMGVDASFDPRIAELIAAAPPPPGKTDQVAIMSADPESMAYKAIANPRPVVDPALINSREWRAAEIPAAGGHATARALASLYGALATGGALDGYRVLTPAAIERAYTEQANGPDLILGVATRWGLGFQLNQPLAPLGPNPRTFGHAGAGGSLGFADPDGRVGFGYVMNQMGSDALIDGRAASLLNAVYAAM
ncbi:MAG TPA: serine hydrolase domain-containing protein [Candidatus Binatus sp.]|nr:serine hydrolase domain-containing protein [Candidatus Binatus sp.]